MGIFPVYGEDVPQEKREPAVEMKCHICDGTGIADDGYVERAIIGRILRSVRMSVPMTIRTVAMYNNLSSASVALLERGGIVAPGERMKILEVYHNIACPQNTEGVRP